MNTDSNSVNPNANHNPFEAPAAPFDPNGMSNTPAEAVRREHLSHEASVKSIGFLYMLGGVIMGLATVAILFFATTQPGAGGPDAVLFIIPLLAVIQCFTAVGLRQLKSWARIPAGIMSAIGLFGFPVGTLINGYILYLLFSAKGTMVFSDEYQTIIAQTPHVKYKTSIIVWVFFGLLLLLITTAVVAVLFG